VWIVTLPSKQIQIDYAFEHQLFSSTQHTVCGWQD